MISRYLFMLSFVFCALFSEAQTDFSALQKQFLDYRKADKQDSALIIARKMNQLAHKEQTDTSYWYALSLRYIGNPHYKHGNYDSTLVYWLKSNDLFEKYHPEISDYAIGLNNLGVLYKKKGDYKAAEPYYIQALEVKKKALGEDHPDYEISLNNLGDLYYKMGDYKAVEPYFKKILEIKKKALGEEHTDYAGCLNNLGVLYKKMGDYNSAEPYYKKALEIYKKALGEENLDYAISLNNLGSLYSNMGDYKAAEPYYKQALEIKKKALGEEHPDYAVCLNNLGFLYKKMGDYNVAEPYYKKALEIYKKALGEEHPDYAKIIGNLGVLYSDMGDYKTAESYIKKAIETYKKALGEEHPSFANSIESLGVLYMTMGDYKAAELYIKRALDIKKKALGEENTDYAGSLNNLGILFKLMGDYKSTVPILKQALEITKNILGEEHPDYAVCLNNLGVLYRKMGDYKAAEPYYKQASEIYKKALGEEHPDYARCLNNLGLFYSNMGDYKAAEPYYKQALEIKKKALGEEHPDYANSLINLGILYMTMRDYKAAEPYYKQALDIFKKALGEEHPDYARSLNKLGILYKLMDDDKSTVSILKQALDIFKKALGEEHPDYANSLNCLGILYSDIGDFISAESYYKQALEISKKAFGEEHQEYLSIQNSLAYVLLKTNREQEAYNLLNKNFSKKSKEIINNFEWLNDNQREAYWKHEIAFYDNLSWFVNESTGKVPEAAGLNYNAALVTKSKMLEAKISKENYYREVDEQREADELREELAYRRRLLAKMESDGSMEKEKLDKLHHEADSLDKRLTISWPEYAQQKKNLSITWDQVQQHLENGEAAIEFIRFKNEDDSLYYYNALVIRKGDINPTLIKLCKEEDLRAISPKMGFSAYYPLIWQPLEGALKDVKTIYYAPTGELYNVPFHAIYAPKGKGDDILAAKTDKRGAVVENARAAAEQNAEFLMDRYTLHQLTSTRYLAIDLKQKAIEPLGNSIAMVGGVNYDYLPGSTATPKKNKKDKNANRSSESASGKLSYLEGTKTEVEQINQQVTTASWQTKLIENNDATEETITKMEGKEAKGILHIATHGFAFPEYDFNDTTVNKNSLRYSYRYSKNPMVRSGVILAGGNWALVGSDTLTKLGAEQNGILTALEVSQLNLKKTKLVVLSACETGLGKIEGSEGTFGLKRGFKLAGVEQMIVSLWSVPDKETMELMTLFYSDLTKTLNPIISFEKAQKEMRNKYPTEPDKWAGFVLLR